MRTCVRGFSPSGTNFSVQACDSIRSLTRILISQGQSRTIGFQTLQKRPQYRDRLCSSVKLTMNVASPEREVKTIPPADYKPGSSLLQVVSEECDVVQLSKADILQIFDALQVVQCSRRLACKFGPMFGVASPTHPPSLMSWSIMLSLRAPEG